MRGIRALLLVEGRLLMQRCRGAKGVDCFFVNAVKIEPFNSLLAVVTP